MSEKIVILGPAYPYRGGIADFSECLAGELQREGHEVIIITFTLQYPSFLFPGKTQYSEGPAPEGLHIRRIINSINPLSWTRAASEIRKIRPSIVISSFWHPYLAPAIGSVSRHCGARVTGLVHNLLPHEHIPGDRLLAGYFCRSVHRFIVLSEAVARDVESFAGRKEIIRAKHPLYDKFGEPMDKREACKALDLDPEASYLLSFGLIRDYKGLDWLIEAYARTDRSMKLIVAGEFYSDGTKYHRLAEELGVDKEIIWRTEFIPDNLVSACFSAADLIVQPYKNATQSGVTQIAYQFGKPMLVTDVGGLGEVVPDGVAGYAVKPNPEAVAEAMQKFMDERPDFSEGIAREREKYSWKELAQKILA